MKSLIRMTSHQSVQMMLISIDGPIWSIMAAQSFTANSKVLVVLTEHILIKKYLHKHKWNLCFLPTLVECEHYRPFKKDGSISPFFSRKGERKPSLSIKWCIQPLLFKMQNTGGQTNLTSKRLRGSTWMLNYYFGKFSGYFGLFLDDFYHPLDYFWHIFIILSFFLKWVLFFSDGNLEHLRYTMLKTSTDYSLFIWTGTIKG
jgi:hypothetical protein